MVRVPIIILRSMRARPRMRNDVNGERLTVSDFVTSKIGRL